MNFFQRRGIGSIRGIDDPLLLNGGSKMAQRLRELHYDVVVIGGGCAGVAAAISAAKTGARTVLVESGPMIGGEMLSGMPFNGIATPRGEWVVGGVARELIDECAKLEGYVGEYFDWRSLWLVSVDPEVMKLVVVDAVRRYGVSLLLYTFAEDVVMENGVVRGVIVLNKSQRSLLTADVFIDCSGDGDLAAVAGAPFELGSPQGEFQPISLIFRMMNVESEPLLRFVVEHPEYFALGETQTVTVSKEQCAQELYKQGIPKVFFDGRGPLLSKAIADGELFPCSMIGVTPISFPRKEVILNTTRVFNVDATDTAALSQVLPQLIEQVKTCIRFMRGHVPGFENALFSGVAPRMGIRETRRIMGDYVLTVEDVLDARKVQDGVAKGCHEVDVHGVGVQHRRDMIKDGGSYDIPFGCLIPKNLKNVLIAGRCLSATREAHSSARAMGTCLAMGEATGTAAAMCVGKGWRVRDVPVGMLRDKLRTYRAIV
jgi:hypothetical protein